jgi:uncharacterized protein YuzE
MLNNISYDPEADAAYFQIKQSTVVESEEIAKGIIVDYDDDDNIIGVELLGLKNFDIQGFKKLTPLLPDLVLANFQEAVISYAFT